MTINSEKRLKQIDEVLAKNLDKQSPQLRKNLFLAHNPNSAYERARRNIRRLRLKNGLSQKTMAKVIDVISTHYSNLEVGRRPFQMSHIAAIADYFSLPVSKLYE